MNVTWTQAKLASELTRDEGKVASPYKDSRGILTVGIGHNLAAGPLPEMKYPLTEAAIQGIFTADTASTVAKLDKFLPWWRSLSDARQRVLINMTFNLGMGLPGSGHGLLAFGTFLNLVHVGNYALASKDMTSTLWARQVGSRATRLASMMKAG